MSQTNLTIEQLGKINPGMREDPPEWTAAAAQREVEAFRQIVESVLGRVDWVGNAGPSTWQAGCSIPPDAKNARENIFMGISLSKFDRLFTITYPWDMKEDWLGRLVSSLAKGGFHYVPFTLFADPADYRWEYAAAFMKDRTPPPKENYGMKYENVWTSLFGYL